ncbi:hypothetical protein GW17_00039339, partial [Ensete ventricosum]
FVAKTLPLASRCTSPRSRPLAGASSWRRTTRLPSPPPTPPLSHSVPLPAFFSNVSARAFRSLSDSSCSLVPVWGFFAAFTRGYRNVRRRGRLPKKKPLELDVNICIEEELPNDHQILVMLGFLCPFSFQVYALLLGDIVISVETASRQAQERGYTPLDEIRVLMVGLLFLLLSVHGLLHLLGFDHEISHEAEAEMEKEEELILRKFGWKGKGLIKSTNHSIIAESHPTSSPNGM